VEVASAAYGRKASQVVAGDYLKPYSVCRVSVPAVGRVPTRRGELPCKFASECTAAWRANKVLAAEYRTVLPDEKLLAEELVRTRRRIGGRPLPGDAP
jgi:hypothetical protein